MLLCNSGAKTHMKDDNFKKYYTRRTYQEIRNEIFLTKVTLELKNEKKKKISERKSSIFKRMVAESTTVFQDLKITSVTKFKREKRKRKMRWSQTIQGFESHFKNLSP